MMPQRAAGSSVRWTACAHALDAKAFARAVRPRSSALIHALTPCAEAKGPELHREVCSLCLCV